MRHCGLPKRPVPIEGGGVLYRCRRCPRVKTRQ
jgi:hypothetical protein